MSIYGQGQKSPKADGRNQINGISLEWSPARNPIALLLSVQPIMKETLLDIVGPPDKVILGLERRFARHGTERKMVEQ